MYYPTNISSMSAYSTNDEQFLKRVYFFWYTRYLFLTYPKQRIKVGSIIRTNAITTFNGIGVYVAAEGALQPIRDEDHDCYPYSYADDLTTDLGVYLASDRAHAFLSVTRRK